MCFWIRLPRKLTTALDFVVNYLQVSFYDVNFQVACYTTDPGFCVLRSLRHYRVALYNPSSHELYRRFDLYAACQNKYALSPEVQEFLLLSKIFSSTSLFLGSETRRGNSNTFCATVTGFKIFYRKEKCEQVGRT